MKHLALNEESQHKIKKIGNLQYITRTKIANRALGIKWCSLGKEIEDHFQ